ncbi:MAG: hypothetical protein V1889_03445 [archaeon]
MKSDISSGDIFVSQKWRYDALRRGDNRFAIGDTTSSWMKIDGGLN